MTPTIQFENVSKKYRLGLTRTSLPELASSFAQSVLKGPKTNGTGQHYFWALHNVGFELSKGETLALVGANGAGKTTTLKLLAKITRPTSGKIQVNGKLSALIELGAGFHPDLTGRENIYLNGSILGLKRSEIQRRFDSIVAFAELEKFIDTPVKRYSSGMAVRLGFAVAASIDPDILLVDEVLAVGDSTFRLKCINRIHELIENGSTLVFVSHNMNLVKAVCEKALYIHKGEMRLFGNTNEVIEAYNRDLNQQRIIEFSKNSDISLKAATGTAQVTKIEVKPIQTSDEKVLMTNQPATIEVHYHAYQDLGEATLVVRIIRSDGVSCCKLHSNNSQSNIIISKGTGKITVTLNPIQLYPNSYQVAAMLKNKKESLTYDYSFSDWFLVESEVSGSIDLDAVFEPNQIWKYEPQV